MDPSVRTQFSFLFCVIAILPAICYSKHTYISSRATFYGSPECSGTPTGACGFGDYGRNVNNGEVSGVSRLYRNGTGCGACYLVRCKVPQYCTDEGTKVVVTDYGEGDNTDFILSVRAYASMARSNVALELFSRGVVDVEYRRIPCYYSNSNLIIKVHENSNFPNYLAIVVLYAGGVNDVTSVEIWKEDCKSWVAMRNAFGAVWDMANPPSGSTNMRVQMTNNADVKWVELPNALPSDWKAGVSYETNVQLT